MFSFSYAKMLYDSKKISYRIEKLLISNNKRLIEMIKMFLIVL